MSRLLRYTLSPPGLLVQFRTGDSSTIQLTKENEKSEPFSYWKRFGFFVCTTTTTVNSSGCRFCFTPAVPGLAGPGASFCLDAKTNPAPQKTDVRFDSINLSNFWVLFVDYAQNKKRFVSTEKQIISWLTGCFRPQKRWQAAFCGLYWLQQPGLESPREVHKKPNAKTRKENTPMDENLSER